MKISCFELSHLQLGQIITNSKWTIIITTGIIIIFVSRL